MSNSVSKGFGSWYYALKTALQRQFKQYLHRPQRMHEIQVISIFIRKGTYGCTHSLLGLFAWNFLDGSVLAKTVAGRVCTYLKLLAVII